METSGVDEQSRRRRSTKHSISFESIASRSAKYRPDVDGLRAIAVLGVLLYHAGVASFRGGFIGVDVFYVISGYLISSILARELAAGKFSIVTFYERRVRRIFPALFTVLFFCIVAAIVLLNPTELISFGKTLVTTTLFVSNIYFWRHAHPEGYFDRGVSSQVLLHTWSLSVEEQFYLFFPVTLFLLYRWTKGRVSVWLAVMAAVSFGLNIWATQHQPVVAFYWIMPRAWELLIGALLATKAVPVPANRIGRETAGLVGLGAIICGLCLPIEKMAFPGYIVLLPCAGTWLVIYAGEGGRCVARSILSFRPLVFIGIISYSLYLWHWPIIVFSRHEPVHLPGGARIPFVLATSVACAFLSFEYIERPFRGGSSPISRRQMFALGFMASVATLGFGFAAYRSRGLPQRYDRQTRQIVASNLERMEDDAQPGYCSNWKTVVHSMADIKFCNFGSQKLRKIVFWGDSHVGQLYPEIERLYSNGAFRERGAVMAIGAGCLPDEHLNTALADYHCDSFSKFAMQRAQQEDVDVVFIGFSTWSTEDDDEVCVSFEGRCVKPLSREQLRQRILADLSEEVRALRDVGKKVIVCLPFPMFDKQIPALEISNAMFGRFGLSESARERTSLVFREEIRAAAIGAGATTFDPRSTLCQKEECLTEVGGISIYRDDNHLAGNQVKILESNLQEVFQQVLRN